MSAIPSRVSRSTALSRVRILHSTTTGKHYLQIDHVKNAYLIAITKTHAQVVAESLMVDIQNVSDIGQLGSVIK
jgi:hypothetical protein